MPKVQSVKTVWFQSMCAQPLSHVVWFLSNENRLWDSAKLISTLKAREALPLIPSDLGFDVAVLTLGSILCRFWNFFTQNYLLYVPSHLLATTVFHCLALFISRVWMSTCHRFENVYCVPGRCLTFKPHLRPTPVNQDLLKPPWLFT